MRNLLFIICFIYSFIALPAVIAEVFIKPSDRFDGFTYYFIFIFLIAFMLLAKQIPGHFLGFKESLKNEGIFNKKNLWLFSLAALSLVGVIFFNIDYRSIWIDEYSQIFELKKKSIVTYAAYSQQTPLDYYYSYIVFNLFGYSEWAVRFVPSLSYLLSGLLITGFALKYSKSYLVSFFILLLFIGHPLVFYYSIEARPTHLASLFSIIYLGYVLEVIKSEKDFNWKDFLPLRLFFLISAGLQPIWLFCALLPWLLIQALKNRNQTPARLILLHSISLLVMTPLLINIYLESTKITQFHESFLGGVKNYFENISFHNFEVYFRNIVFPLLGLIFLFSFKFAKKNIKESVFNLTTLILFVAFFVFSFDLFFRSYINWDLYDRYFIVLPYSLILFLCFYSPSDLLPSKSIVSKKATLFTLPALLIIAFQVSDPFHVSAMFDQSFPLRERYKIIKDHSSADDVIEFFDLGTFKMWNPGLLTAREFYYSEKGAAKFPFPKNGALNGDPFEEIDLAILPMKVFERDLSFKVFMIVESDNKINFLNIWKEEGLDFRSFPIRNGHKVVEIQIPAEDSLEIYLNYLESIAERHDASEAVQLYDRLLYYYYHQDESEKVQEVLKEFDKHYFSKRGDFEENIFQFKIDRRLRLRDKINQDAPIKPGS